jgi:hypothetical protein
MKYFKKKNKNKMNLLRFIIGMFFLQNEIIGFHIPTSFIGKWKPIHHPTYFIIEKDKINVYLNGGHIYMDVKNVTKICDNEINLYMNNLNIVKIPKTINIKNMIKSMNIIHNINKNGLFLYLKYDILLFVKYEIFKHQNGNFEMEKINNSTIFEKNITHSQN